MKFIDPKVEWWKEFSSERHIARVSRICYKAKSQAANHALTPMQQVEEENNQAKRMCESLWKKGHRSMFRHSTVYYYIPDVRLVPMWLLYTLKASAYIHCDTNKGKLWVSTNVQFLRENQKIKEQLRAYIVSEDTFIEEALKNEFPQALMLLRMTLVITMQRIQGNSFNRKSPNNIAEQSTRYVNLKKKGGVLICTPHWEADPSAHFRKGEDGKPLKFPTLRSLLAIHISHLGYRVAEAVYNMLLWCGLNPEDARGNLTFNTYTISAHTYNLHEWRHIVDMRLRDLTGRAHPDAHIIGQMIFDTINNRMREIVPDFTI